MFPKLTRMIRYKLAKISGAFASERNASRAQQQIIPTLGEKTNHSTLGEKKTNHSTLGEKNKSFQLWVRKICRRSARAESGAPSARQE